MGMTFSSKVLIHLAIFSTAIACPLAEQRPCQEQYLYRIRRANIDGTQVENLGRDLPIDGPKNIQGIALDSAHGRLFYTDASGSLYSLQLNGKSPEVLLPHSKDRPRSIAFSTTGNFLYATACNFRIMQFNMDDFGIKYYDVEEEYGCDPDSHKTFPLTNPSDVNPDKLVPCSSDFLHVNGYNWHAGLAVDSIRGRVYWANRIVRKIQSASLEEGKITDVVSTGLSPPLRLAIDPSEGKLYWSNAGSIHRANLDGTARENLPIPGLKDPWGLAVDAQDKVLYWTDRMTDKIQRSNLDGSDVRDVLATDLADPMELVLDPIAKKIYWTESGSKPSGWKPIE